MKNSFFVRIFLLDHRKNKRWDVTDATPMLKNQVEIKNVFAFNSAFYIRTYEISDVILKYKLKTWNYMFMGTSLLIIPTVLIYMITLLFKELVQMAKSMCWSWSRDMVSLACHKNCERGETVSLALFKTENKCLMCQRACGMASLRTSHIAIGDCQSGAFFFLASSKIFR